MNLKWPTLPPPDLRTMRVINFCAVAFMAGLAVVQDNRWIAMIDAFLAGFNFAAGIFCTYQMRMQQHLDRMSDLCDSMMQMNLQLIKGKVEIIMEGGDPNADRPSVH